MTHRIESHTPAFKYATQDVAAPSAQRIEHFSDGYLKTLASNFDVGHGHNAMYNMFQVLDVLAAEHAQYAHDFAHARMLLGQGSRNFRDLLANTSAPQLAQQALNQLRYEGHTVLPLIPSGKHTLFGTGPGAHFLLVHMARAGNGTIADVYNLGMGSGNHVSPAQQAVVGTGAQVRMLLNMAGQFLFKQSPSHLGMKIPPRLRICLNALPERQDLQKIFTLGGLQQANEKQPPRFNADQIDAVYAALRAMGQEDLQAPQRFQAPQDAPTCLHKTAMALVANSMPEYPYRLFRAKLLRWSEIAARQVSAPHVHEALQRKADKAQLQSDAAYGKQTQLRSASDVPSLPRGVSDAMNWMLSPTGLGRDWTTFGVGMAAQMLAKGVIPYFSLASTAVGVWVGVQAARLPRHNAGL